MEQKKIVQSIEKYRKQKGLSKYQLAQRAGISYDALWRIINGKTTRVREDTLKKIVESGLDMALHYDAKGDPVFVVQEMNALYETVPSGALQEFLNENPDLEQDMIETLQHMRFLNRIATKQTYIEIVDVINRTTRKFQE